MKGLGSLLFVEFSDGVFLETRKEIVLQRAFVCVFRNNLVALSSLSNSSSLSH